MIQVTAKAAMPPQTAAKYPFGVHSKYTLAAITPPAISACRRYIMPEPSPQGSAGILPQSKVETNMLKERAADVAAEMVDYARAARANGNIPSDDLLAGIDRLLSADAADAADALALSAICQLMISDLIGCGAERAPDQLEGALFAAGRLLSGAVMALETATGRRSSEFTGTDG